MAAKGVLQLLLITVVLVTVSRAEVEYLYYTSPGGAAYGELPGFYGAAADWRQNGSALDYPDSGYQCADVNDDVKRGLFLRSISMDPKTRTVLMNVWEEARKVSLLTGELCLTQDMCENTTVKPTWIFNNAQLENKAGPFAYYNSKIYFIFLREEDEGAGRKQTIELRVFSGCEEKYPVHDWTAFYISECSTKIAVLDEVTFDIVSPVRVSDTLFITNSGGDLSFLVLLQRGIYDRKAMATGYKMELILVKQSTKEVTTLHTEELDVNFLRYATFHVGAISMRNNKLCWSAMDRILCADWAASGGISNVQTILPKGKAVSACSNTGAEITTVITTGIAIANTDKEMAIFFGCVAQRSGYGGAGLVRKTEDKISVFPLLVNNTEIFAGNMFLMSHCRPEKADPVQSEDGYGYVYASTAPPSSCMAAMLGSFAALGMLLMIHL